jgi:hypothetical protein
LRIIELEVENVKRIRAVELKPVGDVVVISGKNGQGKTSVLDSIEWVFAGAKHIQAVPVRKGEKKGHIKVKIGNKDVELIVERRLGVNAGLTVTTAEGFTPPGGAQAVLDALLGALSFDPLAFWRMDAKKQFDELLRVFPISVDPAKIDGLNKTDYAKRTEVNRDAKTLRTQAAAITVAAGLPPEPIDESALLDRITDAADGNSQIETRKAKRADAARLIENARAMGVQIRQKAEAMRLESMRLYAEGDAKDVEADALQKKLDEAPPLPEPVDIAALRSELDAAKATNTAIAARQKRERLEGEALALEAESKRLTEQMEAREQEKRDAVAAAKFPVDGLGFGDGVVTLGGVPFDQASSSEALKVSVAIGMAANPELRVILVRDGSLLDEDSRKQIAQMAKDADYQLWLEVAGKGEKTGFIIEDGAVLETLS